MKKNLIIEQVSNGYIVRQADGDGYIPHTLAVFNNITDLTAWLEENFRLPSKEGGAA